MSEVKPSTNPDQPEIGYALFGFTLPLVGLFYYAFNRRKTPLRAKSTLKGVAAGLSLVTFLSVSTALYLRAESQKEFEKNWPLRNASNRYNGPEAYFANVATEFLLNKDYAVMEHIDFDHLRIGEDDFGATHRAAPNALLQRINRINAVNDTADYFQSQGVTIDKTSKWRIHQRKANGCEIYADTPAGTLTIGIRYQGDERKIDSIGLFEKEG